MKLAIPALFAALLLQAGTAFSVDPKSCSRAVRVSGDRIIRSLKRLASPEDERFFWANKASFTDESSANIRAMINHLIAEREANRDLLKYFRAYIATHRNTISERVYTHASMMLGLKALPENDYQLSFTLLPRAPRVTVPDPLNLIGIAISMDDSPDLYVSRLVEEFLETSTGLPAYLRRFHDECLNYQLDQLMTKLTNDPIRASQLSQKSHPLPYVSLVITPTVQQQESLSKTLSQPAQQNTPRILYLEAGEPTHWITDPSILSHFDRVRSNLGASGSRPLVFHTSQLRVTGSAHRFENLSAPLLELVQHVHPEGGIEVTFPEFFLPRDSEDVIDRDLPLTEWINSLPEAELKAVVREFADGLSKRRDWVTYKIRWDSERIHSIVFEDFEAKWKLVLKFVTGV